MPSLAPAVLRHRTWLIALFQSLLIFCSLVLAWLLRFDFALPYRTVLFSTVPILILIRLAAMARFHLHHGWWKYTGFHDTVDILKAVTIGSAGFYLLMRYVLWVSFPRSIYILEALLTTCLLAGVRLLSRAIVECFPGNLRAQKRVMIIGAGSAAQMTLREIQGPGSGYVAVACVDDAPSKVGIRIHGVPVVGTVAQLPALLQRNPVDQILIAVPSANSAQTRRFVHICEQAGVPFKTVPRLRDLIAGRVIISQIRDVNMEDLLSREPAEIDLASVRKQIEGRVLAVTGAAGSIGSELCRQILEYWPAGLLCIDRSENGIFHLQLELSKHQSAARLIFCVADVGDSERMRKLFADHGIQIVFHAAAYKHVPILEGNVHEAVKNNVLALFTLLDLAEEGGCESFVMISSDKAVNPTSIMGATKRIGELILHSRPAGNMRCVTVRFGNVLGSNGSVVPLFQEQLRKNQELTITHPDAKRFFMTTREAVALVLQAFAIGKHGDILVLDMGEPVRIVDLAQSLIRLSGKSTDQVRIRFTGLREGEKLIEELAYPTEKVYPTSCQTVKRIRNAFDGWPKLKRQIEELRVSLSKDGAAPIRAKIKEIVPEYSYSPGENHKSAVEQIIELALPLESE